VRGELAADAQERLERQLEGCEECLLLYMEAAELEQPAHPLPELDPVASKELDDRVMELIHAFDAAGEIPAQPRIHVRPQTRRSRKWPHHPAFHYGIAAVITIVLMSTGVFSQLSVPVRGMNSAKQSAAQTGLPTVTDKVMERTIHLLDSIYPISEGGR
jgi:hypothetical protein